MLRRPLDFLQACRARYGDCFRARFPGIGELVFVADPAEVKRIFLGPPEVFRGGEGNAEVTKPALGMGVMNLDGDEHMRHRKLLLPPFRGDNLRFFEEQVFADAALRDMERWPDGRPFELISATRRISLDAILRALLGGEPRTVSIEDLSQSVLDFDRSTWVLAVKPLHRGLGRFSPWRRFTDARANLDELLYREIRARRAAPSGGNDVLSLLLEAREPDGRGMSDRELRDDLVTMIIAGYETTSATLAHAFELILRAPHVHERVRSAPDDDEYLTAVVSETLRMRPSVTDASRVLAEETEVAGYLLPPGQHVLASLPLVLTRPQSYEDPLAFRPERFLGEEPETEPYAYIPWGGGVRRCIGAAFAQAELRVVIRTVFENARLAPDSMKPERPRLHRVILVPGRGARTVVTERSRRRPPRVAHPTAHAAAV